MNRKIYSIPLLSLIVLSLLVLVPQIVSATIFGRPTIYYMDAAGDPLYVPAGASVSINLNGMTISGAQVWLWISKSGGAAIEPGDKFLVGPFYLGDVFDSTPTPHIYVFRPGVNLPSPWSAEGRNYVYMVGNGWINGTMPLMVEGGEYYWLKITDVDPRLGPSIPSSDVSVSNNRIVFTPVFTATPPDGSTLAPSTPITIKGYALPLDEKYNITQDSTKVYTLLSPELRTISGWNYTVLEVPPFPLLDLGLRYPDSDGTVYVEVVANSTGSTVATFTYTEPARVVYLDIYGLLNHRGNYYPSGVVLYTGEYYNVTLNWFPYMGSVSIYLNTTLLASGVPLNATGGIENYAVKIPNVPSGKYVFKIIDNNGVEYNFTVSVVMAPYIEVEPTEGYVGDTITVHGYNFLDHVGEYVTIYFETCGGNYELLANFTVPSSEWSYDITVPLAPGGTRVVEVRDSTGTYVIDDATFTILPKIDIVPSSVASDYTGLIKVLGLGFEPYYGYWITVDNTFAGVSYCGDCGNFTAILLGGGFRPGLHVVAVYDWDLGLLLAYKHFIVTEEGDIIAGKLNTLNAVITSIQGDVAVIKTDVGEIKIKLDALNATIVEVRDGVVAIQTTLGVIEGKLDDIKSYLEGMNATIVGIKDDVAVIKTDVGEIKIKLDALNATIVEVRDGVVAIQTTLGVIEGKLDDIKSYLEGMNATIVGIKDDVAVIKTDVGEIKIKLDALNATIVEVRDGVVAIQTTLGVIEGKLDDIKSYLEGMNATIVGIKDDVAVIKTDVGEIKIKLDALNATIVEVRDGVVAIQTTLGVIEGKLDDIKSYLEGMNATIVGIKDDVAVIKTDVGEIKIKLDAVNASISGLIVDSKGEVLAKIDTALGIVMAKLDALNATIVEVRDGVVAIQTTLGVIEGKLDDIKSYLEGMNATIVGIKDDVAVIKTDVGEIKIKLDAVNASISGLIVDSKGEVLAKIDTALGIVMAKLDALNATIVEVRDGVVAIQTTLGVIEGKLDDIKSYLESMNATLTGLIVDSKGEVLAKIDTATGTILARLDAINAVITSIQGDVATIKTDVGTIKADVGTIKSIVENNNALLLEIKDGVATIKTDVGTIKADVAAIKPVITSIQGDVATIKTDVGTIKADVAAIKPVVTEIKDGVATINTALGDLKGVVITINGNVATIMTDVGTIKADVSTVKSGVEDVKSGISGVRGDVSGVMYAVIAAVILSLIAAVAAIYSVMSIRKALVH